MYRKIASATNATPRNLNNTGMLMLKELKGDLDPQKPNCTSAPTTVFRKRYGTTKPMIRPRIKRTREVFVLRDARVGSVFTLLLFLRLLIAGIAAGRRGKTNIYFSGLLR